MPGIKRGDLVTVALQGDFGKPRPALVIQADWFLAGASAVVVCALTSSLVAAPLLRIPVEPDAGNGLRVLCQIQIDRIFTVRREKLGPVIGTLDAGLMTRVTRSLALFLGFG